MKHLVTVEFPDGSKKDLLVKAENAMQANKDASKQLGISLGVSIFCDSGKYWASVEYGVKKPHCFMCYASEKELKDREVKND